MIRLADHAIKATQPAPLAALSPSHFYFVDGPNKSAKVQRCGLSAREANARLRLTLRVLAAENDKRQREKRIADLAYFYAEAQAEGIELSPFE